MLSVIIPSYKDPFLYKTIQSIIDNFTGDFEVIPVIDGYELKIELQKDERVKPLILTENVGMREAINKGVEVAIGSYLMRTDEHCMFAPGFDSTILETIQDNWIVTARRYFLDPQKWEVMEEKGYIDYERMIIDDRYPKLAAVKWKERTARRSHIMIDETMAMQGSMWVMSRFWWENVIGRLDSEGYGTLYQDSTEMLFKTWADGGKLMLNKNTWYAHKCRDFKRTHNYPGELSRASWSYALHKHYDDFMKIQKRFANG